jgi:hypothetical protein
MDSGIVDIGRETGSLVATEGWMPGVTSTQIGKACESLVACSLMLASKGRIAPFMPLADDDGLDMLLLDKLTGKTIAVQVKSRTGTDAATRGTVQFDVRRKTYTTRYGGLLLAVVVDVEKVAIGQSWLVPMDQLPKVSNEKSDVFAMVASTLETSKDRCRLYRCETVAELVGRLLARLDQGSAVPSPIMVRERLEAPDKQPQQLVEHLRIRCRSDDCPDRRLCEEILAFLGGSGRTLPDLRWETSHAFAQLIDGYRLCFEAGLGDPFQFAERKLSEAKEIGTWSGSPLELWVSLFLEHRRWRFAGWEPEGEQVKPLDALCQKLIAALTTPSADV